MKLYFLSHVSYVDTTKLISISDELVQAALADPTRNHGPIAPFLVERVKAGVAAHEVMETLHRNKVLVD